MRVISRKALVEAAERHPDAGASLDIWYRITKRAMWRNLVDTRKDFRSADAVQGLTVFNVKGNHYRLITRINYVTQKVFIRGFYKHAHYNRGDWKS